MMWHDGWGGGNWLVMSLMMLLFLVFVIVVVVWAVSGRRYVVSPEVNRARQILDECFASGEIDVEEYARRRDHLAAR